MRYFTALCSVQYDKCAECVILSEAKNLFIRGTRYFTTLRSVQYELRGRCHFEQSEKSQKKTQTLLLSALLEVLPLESSRGLHPLAP